MAPAITLHELIDQVKEELLLPTAANTPEALYPFLFVDEVEITAQVTVTAQADGSGKFNVYVVEATVGGETSQEKGHTVRVKLSPLVTKDEIRTRLQLDDRLWQRIQRTAEIATVKEIALAQG